MSQLIEKLPGVFMSVEEVTDTLSKMWEQDSSDPVNYRASQLNLILHFGLSTTEAEAMECFDSAIQFAQRYPCRIVVLCPSETADQTKEFQGKLFTQCYIGKDLRDVCCCEAMILGYSVNQSDFLEDQVSIWMEADLPVYHWFHRVPADRITKYYLSFTKRCRRILFDGEIDGDDYDSIDWPDPSRIRDLAYARTLPLRQHLGQFLSRFERKELVEGLQTIRVQYHVGMRRMAYQLMRWHRTAIEKCFQKPADADAVVFTLEQLVQEGADSCIRIDWQYTPADKCIKWKYNTSQREGLIHASISGTKATHPLHIEPLGVSVVLAEAMFFG